MPAMRKREPSPADKDSQPDPDAPAASQSRGPAMTDDELRRAAAGQLAQHLELGAALVARCETLSQAPRGDRLGPLYAAARLMRANAQVAQVLAHVALVERRNRSIVEHIQPPDPKKAELNSNLRTREVTAQDRLKFYNRLNEHIEQTIRARTGESEERDSVAFLIQEAEDSVERLKKERAEFDAG